MASSVFATVCNPRDISSAKQLFAAAATKGGWDGDYCLICRDFNDEQVHWFESRGVVVMPAGPVIDEEIWAKHRRGKPIPQVPILKFHLFTEAFRRWKSVVYMDTDIIIRGPIGSLAEVGSFSAAPDNMRSVGDQFLDPKVAEPFLDGKQLRSLPFNGGTLAFPTASIPPDTFEKLIEIAHATLVDARNSDQTFMNVLFSGKWNRLSADFNAMAFLYGRFAPAKYAEILSRARVVHYAGRRKPSDPRSPGHREWRENLRIAEDAESFALLKTSPPAADLAGAKAVDRTLVRLHAFWHVYEYSHKLKKLARSPLVVLRNRTGAARSGASE